jgi:hypothetical protein
MKARRGRPEAAPRITTHGKTSGCDRLMAGRREKRVGTREQTLRLELAPG